jgi:carboxylesterase
MEDKENNMKNVHPLAEPFFIPGNSQQVLLFLHGFTASPSEVRSVAEKLNKINNCSVSGILLPGHGTTPEQLNNVRWPEWYKEVEDELKLLLNKYQQVFVGGLSMGGLLALHAGVNIDGLAGVISINAPIFYRHLLLLAYANAISPIKPYYPKKISTDLKDLEKQGRFAYRLMPMKAFHSLDHLRKIVIKELQGIKAPALIIQSLLDESVHPRSGDFLYAKTRINGAKLIMLPQAKHIATMGIKNEIIAREMAQFIEVQGS